MFGFAVILTIVIVFAVVVGLAQQPLAAGPYKVLKTVRAGGEGNWDYIYADVAGRRLYIPRRGSAETGVPTRLSIFNLDTLEPVGEIDGIGGKGKTGGPKTGDGLPGSKTPPTFAPKTEKEIKTVAGGPGAAPEGHGVCAV